MGVRFRNGTIIEVPPQIGKISAYMTEANDTSNELSTSLPTFRCDREVHGADLDEIATNNILFREGNELTCMNFTGAHVWGKE